MHFEDGYVYIRELSFWHLVAKSVADVMHPRGNRGDGKQKSSCATMCAIRLHMHQAINAVIANYVFFGVYSVVLVDTFSFPIIRYMTGSLIARYW